MRLGIEYYLNIGNIMGIVIIVLSILVFLMKIKG